MRPQWKVSLLGFETLREIEGHWSSTDFTALLETMEYGETSELSEAELREMTLLSLQDRSPTAAAEILVGHRLKARLTKGQIATIAHDLAEEGEKLWEHYADMSLHEELFAVGSLASEAFPSVFPEPDAAKATLRVLPTNAGAHEAIAEGLREPLLARLVADGMAGDAILHRLFEDQLAANLFEEAKDVLWTCDVAPAEAGVTVAIISAGIWLDPLSQAEEFTSTAWPDARPAEPKAG